MAIDQKILQRGYSTKNPTFPRTHFNNELNKLDKEARLPAKSKFECKKNKGEHTWTHVKPDCSYEDRHKVYPGSKAQEMANYYQENKLDTKYKGLFSLSRGANVYQCSGCGKIDIRWNPNNSVFV